MSDNEGKEKSDEKKKGRPLKKIIIISLVVVVVLASLAVVAVGYIAGDALAHPKREAIFDTPWENDLPWENITFKSTDGIELSGWFIPSSGGNFSNVTIILAHGYGDCKSQMIPYAKYLHNLSFNLLLFDFRAHGESGGDVCSIAYFEVRDVEGAMNYLATRPSIDINRTGILGLSMGAATAIRAAAMDHRLKVVVADSPFSSGDRVAVRAFTHFSGYPQFPFGPVAVFFMERQIGAKASDIDITGAAGKLDDSQSLMVIGGTEDSVAGDWDARHIYDNAKCNKDLWIIQGSGHIQGLVDHPDMYKNRTGQFFVNNL